MPVLINWDNEDQTILRIEFISPWTWEEAYRAADKAYQMIESVDQIVDAILDWSRSTRLPMNALSNAKVLSRSRHHLAGITVACNANPALAAMWVIFARLYGALGIEPRYHLVENLEQARAKLRQIQLRRESVRV